MKKITDEQLQKVANLIGPIAYYRGDIHVLNYYEYEESDYIRANWDIFKPKIPWHFPVPTRETEKDTLVYVFGRSQNKWLLRYFGGILNIQEGFFTFIDGASSLTTDKSEIWTRCVIANPKDLKELPPIPLVI